MDGAAERNDYALPVAYPFRFSDYAGYSHVKTKDDGVGAVDESDEFVTYVFRLKERIGRRQSKTGSTPENGAIRLSAACGILAISMTIERVPFWQTLI